MVYKLRVSPFRDLGKQPRSNLLKASPPNWNKLIYPSTAPASPGIPRLPCFLRLWRQPGCLVQAGLELPRREGAVPRFRAGSEAGRTRSRSFHRFYSRRPAARSGRLPSPPHPAPSPLFILLGTNCAAEKVAGKAPGRCRCRSDRCPWSTPPRARGRAAPEGFAGEWGIRHLRATPGLPPSRLGCLVTAWEQKPGGTDTRPVRPCPACPKRQPRPVRAATSLALADYVSLVGCFDLGGCVGRLPPPTEGAPSRKQKGAAGINVYSKASLVQALHPEVGRRAGGGSFRPSERAGGGRSGPPGASRPPGPSRMSLPLAASPCAWV